VTRSGKNLGAWQIPRIDESTLALGAYQLTPIALEDIGWKDKSGARTAKSGITMTVRFYSARWLRRRLSSNFSL
jgi:hypothetical protein